MIRETGTIDVVLVPHPERFVTVGDVRAWLRRVETLGIADTAQLLDCELSISMMTDLLVPVEDPEPVSERHVDVLCVFAQEGVDDGSVGSVGRVSR